MAKVILTIGKKIMKSKVIFYFVVEKDSKILDRQEAVVMGR